MCTFFSSVTLRQCPGHLYGMYEVQRFGITVYKMSHCITLKESQYQSNYERWLLEIPNTVSAKKIHYAV